jgi:CRISPR-associated protein Csm5
MMLSLQVLTPLCVRSGENASAITDYIHDRIRRVIYLIDQEKLNQWLMDQGESARYLVKEIASIAASQRGSLANFFEEHNLSPHDFSQAILPLAFPDSITFRNWSLLLPTLTGRKPYIPGSSIKGAIRTALMFDYIKKLDKGRFGYGATPHLPNSPHHLYYGLDIFCLPGKRSQYLPENDALRFLQVTDTSPSPLESLRVYALERKGGSRNAIPTLLLGFYPSTEMKFEISILPGYEKANIPEYWKEFFSKGTTTILKAIWEYSRLLLIDEIKRLNKKAHMEENKSLIQEYTRLLNENKNEIKQGGSLLRIGFGKTYFFNSIGYYLSDQEKKKYLPNFKKIKSDDEFPTTRWMIHTLENHYLPAGWSLLKQDKGDIV